MGGRTLSAAPEVGDGAADSCQSGTGNPALRLLDALRAGDDLAVLEVCGPTTTVSAENMAWSGVGREQIRAMLAEARDRFPGLTFESRTRHVGFGLVTEEARVRDVEPEADPDAIGSADDPGDTEERSDHPMYDDPSVVVPSTSRALTLWHDPGGDEPPAPLNLPVRVTVQHDDLMVHDVALSFPAALLKRALGVRVDPFELSLSEVQSAFVAPAEGALVTSTLSGSDPAPVRDATAPFLDLHVADDLHPRRRRRWLPVLLVVLALVAAGAWWAMQGHGSAAAASASVSTAASPSPVASTRPSPAPSARPSASQAPPVTRAQPADTPNRRPNVTLRSDLAFGFNSATLSAEARTAIDGVARQVVAAGLHGRIYVEGYTDSTGSASYGVVLSQKRADTVSSYLQSRLLGAPVSIVSTGHGESDPVADNATAAGRKANRRVTITLPRS
jgi:outer membrane protein OmpA-like peptidoglycan-associated protein